MLRSRLISWGILLAALAVLFHRLLLGEVLFWGLPSLQFIPWRIEAIDLLRAGQLPWWTSLNGAGAPLLANYQSALLYPLNWPGLILPAALTMSLTAVAHLFIAGIGMWTLTGALGIPSLGRGVSTLAFGLSGYLVARAGTFPMVEAAAWLPWLLWMSVRLIEQVTPRRIGWMAIFTALLLLAGHAQTAWYTLLLTGLFTLIVQSPRRPLGIAAALAGLLLGLGIAALQLMGTAELLGQSQRSDGVSFDFAMNLSYAPARVLNLFAPHVFGTPANGSYITGGAYFEDAVYIGLIPLIGAIAAVITWIRRRSESARFLGGRLIPFWVAVVVIGFVLALGVNTPVFPFLFENVPTFDAFQAPVRWHLWTVTGLSILGGIGASFWWRGRLTRRWSMRLFAGAAIAVILVFGMQLLAPSAIPAVNLLARAVISVGLLSMASAFLTLSQPAPDSPKHSRWGVLVLLVLAADLVYASWGTNPTTNADFYDPRPRETATRVYWRPDRLEAVRYEQFLRFDDYRLLTESREAYRDSLLPDMNMLDNASVLNNFDPLQPSLHLDYMELLDSIGSDALVQAAGAGMVMDRAGQTVLADDAPRAWLVRSACWHTTDDSLRASLSDPAWDPYGQGQVHFLGDAGCAEPLPVSGSVQIVRDDGGFVELAVEAERDSWLVLADTQYPGWSAVVNDSPAPIFTANLAFRAVQVDAGSSVVQFRYGPSWALPGALISTVSLLGLLVLFRVRADARRD